jgi:hypothetical protein
MTDTEILDKIIEKAIQNGLDKDHFNKTQSQISAVNICLSPISPSCSKFINHLVCYYNPYSNPESANLLQSNLNYRLVIFDHNFAKAFWGSEMICKDGTTLQDWLQSCSQAGMTEQEARDDWELDEDCNNIPLWQYHLQKIVLSQEPLKYFEKFLLD